MGHGKKESRKKLRVWKILDGSYKPRKKPIGKEDVEWLIAGIQQECYWTDRDVETWDAINSGKIDWSGDVRSKRKPRKYFRKCSKRS
jgi:hypothetical protein